MNNNDFINRLRSEINEAETPESITPQAVQIRLAGVRQKKNKIQYSVLLTMLIISGFTVFFTYKADEKPIGGTVSMFDYLQQPNDYATLFYRIKEADKKYDFYNYGATKFTLASSQYSISEYGEVKFGQQNVGGMDTVQKPEYYETNSRAEGVQEADIMKTDGRYIYYLDSEESRICTVKAENGKTELMSELTLEDSFYNGIKEQAKDEALNTATPTEPSTPTEASATESSSENVNDGSGLTEAELKKYYCEYIDNMVTEYMELYIYGDTVAVIAQKLPNSNDISVDKFRRYGLILDGIPYLGTEFYNRFDAIQAYATRIETDILFYDFSDREHPVFKNSIAVSGAYISSRMTDGYIYVVTNEHIYSEGINKNVTETFAPTIRAGCRFYSKPVSDIYLFNDLSDTLYTNVCGIDVRDFGSVVSSKSLLGGGNNIYSNLESLYIFGNLNYDYLPKRKQCRDDINSEYYVYIKTKLTKLRFENGKVELAACRIISGGLLNQFALDEYNGYLRLIALNWGTRTDENGNRNPREQWTRLLILDKDLSTVSYIDDTAPGELLKSVRFDGDVGYFATYKAEKSDPLFTVDLSNPYAPQMLSALKIPDFSTYLHPFGEDKLLGLGVNVGRATASAESGVKLTMFDVSDKTDVTEEHTRTIKTSYSTPSEKLTYGSFGYYNYKALIVSPEKNVIGFPIVYQRSTCYRRSHYTHSEYVRDKSVSYLFFRYDEENGFTPIGEAVAFSDEIAKVIIDDSVNYNNESYFNGMICTQDGKRVRTENVRGTYIGDYLYVISQFGCLSYTFDDFTQIDSLDF